MSEKKQSETNRNDRLAQLSSAASFQTASHNPPDSPEAASNHALEHIASIVSNPAEESTVVAQANVAASPNSSGHYVRESTPNSLTLFCAAASGMTAVNYLAEDPDLAAKESSYVREATRKARQCQDEKDKK